VPEKLDGTARPGDNTLLVDQALWKAITPDATLLRRLSSEWSGEQEAGGQCRSEREARAAGASVADGDAGLAESDHRERGDTEGQT
jgi:hypothetical protein